MVWTAAFYYYRHFGAVFIHSIIVGGPSSLSFPPEWIFDGTLDNRLPLFGWSLVRLGLPARVSARLAGATDHEPQVWSTAQGAVWVRLLIIPGTSKHLDRGGAPRFRRGTPRKVQAL